MEGKMQRIVQEYVGKPTKYLKVTASDTAQTLSASQRQDSNGNEPRYGFVDVETNDARFTFSSDSVPTTAGNGSLLSTGDHWVFYSEDEIKQFQFVNKTSGSNATLHFHFWY
jgi:hypothetical protein